MITERKRTTRIKSTLKKKIIEVLIGTIVHTQMITERKRTTRIKSTLKEWEIKEYFDVAFESVVQVITESRRRPI